MKLGVCATSLQKRTRPLSIRRSEHKSFNEKRVTWAIQTGMFPQQTHQSIEEQGPLHEEKQKQVAWDSPHLATVPPPPPTHPHALSILPSTTLTRRGVPHLGLFFISLQRAS